MVLFVCRGAESLGISHLSAMLKAEQIETKLAFDPSLFDDTKYLHYPKIPKLLKYNEKFSKHIISLKPKVIAFSVLTMNFLWALDIAKRVKAHIDVVTVFGGIHVQSLPEQVLQYPQVDFILRGEGEYSFISLIKSIYKREPDLDIGGLGYKINGELKLNPVAPSITDLDALPFADRDIFSPYEDFSQSMIYMAGRGCPMKCTFCDSPVQKEHFPNSNQYLRYRSVALIMEELKLLKSKYNVQSFHMVDDIFTVNKTWLEEFCSRYPGEIGIPFQVTSYPSLLSEDKVRMLKQAGCIYVQVGVQSLNQENRRKILDRRETNEQVAESIDLCLKHDLPISLDYIFFPWEKSNKDQLYTARFLQEHPPTRLANFYLSYLPGTPLIDWALKNGYLKENEVHDIELGKTAYYHAGGEYLKTPEILKFFDNFYNFFLLVLIIPSKFNELAFKLRAWKYARFIPKTPLIIFKELILPALTSTYKASPPFIRYARYYFKNYKSILFGQYHSD